MEKQHSYFSKSRNMLGKASDGLRPGPLGN